MFRRGHIGSLSFYAGWFPAFSRLCAAIDALLGRDKRDFHWRFAEERNGGARYGYGIDEERVTIPDEVDGHPSFVNEPGPNDQQARHIYRLVWETRDATEQQCIVCGRPARLSGLKGVVLPLCPNHSNDHVIRNVWNDAIMTFDESDWAASRPRRTCASR